MPLFYGVFEKALVGCGRIPNNGTAPNKTYVNVLIEVQRSNQSNWLLLLQNSGLGDPAFHRFAVEMTEAQYDLYNELESKYHDGHTNLPRWQHQTGESSQTLAIGSFADPESAASAFSAGVQIPDDRLIVRVYNENPGTIGVHIPSEDLDESSVPGFVRRYLRLFTPADAPIGGAVANAANVKTVIAGKNMIFDMGSSHSPALLPGASSFEVPTTKAGTVLFPSSGSYRIVGPAGEKQVIWSIYGRRLEVQG